MTYLIVWLIGSGVSWVLLVVALLLVRRIADIGFASLGDLLWRAAVVVAVVNVVVTGVSIFSGILAWIVALVLFVGMLMKMFDLDLWQGVVVVIAVWVLRMIVVFALLGAALA